MRTIKAVMMPQILKKNCFNSYSQINCNACIFKNAVAVMMSTAALLWKSTAVSVDHCDFQAVRVDNCTFEAAIMTCCTFGAVGINLLHYSSLPKFNANWIFNDFFTSYNRWGQVPFKNICVTLIDFLPIIKRIPQFWKGSSLSLFLSLSLSLS